MIGFADVPHVRDRTAASQLPQLAVLSVMAHPELEIAEIAIEAISQLPEVRAGSRSTHAKFGWQDLAYKERSARRTLQKARRVTVMYGKEPLRRPPAQVARARSHLNGKPAAGVLAVLDDLDLAVDAGALVAELAAARCSNSATRARSRPR